jgi:hypothetical protein
MSNDIYSKHYFKNMDFKKIGRYSFKFFMVVLSIVLIQILFDGFNEAKLKNLPKVLLFLITASLIMGLVLWLIDIYYAPKRQAKLYQKLLQTFDGKRVTDDTLHFHVNGIDFFVQISVKIEISQTGGFEKIAFYVPQNQMDVLQTKPKFTYKPQVINGMPCYKVYETNGWGISMSKKYILKRMNALKEI